MSEIVVKVEIPGLENLIRVLERLAGGTQNVTAQSQTMQVQPVQQVQAQPVPIQAAQVPVQQLQGAPVQQQQPVMQAPVQQQMPMQVPTTAISQEFTQDQLAVAAAGLVNQGKQPRLFEILHSFGANSLVELPKERYGEFAVSLRAEGAVI